VTWLSLDGAVNARDLGGLPTVDGRLTQPGVLLRADNLQDLSERDVDTLLEQGVRTVVDLRTAAEVELLGPGPLRKTDVRHLHLDLIPHGFDGQPPLARAIPDETAGPHAVDHLYFDYIQDAPDQIGTALRTIADPNSGSVLVHCAAGKDRTGVVIALALSLVGVHRDAVVADYARSDERVALVRDRLIATPLYSESISKRSLESMRPHAGNMERFLDRIDREYGGLHAFGMAVGIEEGLVAKLSRRLLGVH